MTANTMREAVLKILASYKQEMEHYGYYTSNPGVSVDDFEDIADEIVAWQAAQSVPVVGEPVAWGVTKRYEDNVWFISDSRFTAQHYANQYAHRIGAEPDQVVIPLFDKPTHSITAAELATLREKAAEADELRKDAARYQFIRALENDAVAVQLVKSECDVELDDAIDAAIAQGGE